MCQEPEPRADWKKTESKPELKVFKDRKQDMSKILRGLHERFDLPVSNTVGVKQQRMGFCQRWWSPNHAEQCRLGDGWEQICATLKCAPQVWKRAWFPVRRMANKIGSPKSDNNLSGFFVESSQPLSLCPRHHRGKRVIEITLDKVTLRRPGLVRTDEVRQRPNPEDLRNMQPETSLRFNHHTKAAPMCLGGGSPRRFLEVESCVGMKPDRLEETMPGALCGRKVVPVDFPPERVPKLTRRLPPGRSKIPSKQCTMAERGDGEKVHGMTSASRGKNHLQEFGAGSCPVEHLWRSEAPYKLQKQLKALAFEMSFQDWDP